MISYVCDSAPSKQNKFLPGTRIPIFPPEYLFKNRPDYLLILPWNIADEIIKEFKGHEFYISIPELKKVEIP